MNTDQIRNEKATKIYAAVITIMLFASATGLIMYHSSNSDLKQAMDDEKIKTEGLLSEKLSLEKEVSKMMGELNGLKGDNSSLTKKWKDAIASISDRDSKINGMNNENKKAKQLISEVDKLRTVKSEMSGELERVKSELASTMAENVKLIAQVSSLENENLELASTIESLNQVAVNNSLVEATKGKKDRLTVAAKKTKKLKVGFDLPVEMVGNLYFKMVTPNGKEVSSHESTISFYEVDATPVDMIASADKVIGKGVEKKHIDMVYKPIDKLESGIYKIDVYSSDKYLGTTRVHLK